MDDNDYLMRHYAEWLNNPDEMYAKTIQQLEIMVSMGHISFAVAEEWRHRAEMVADHCKRINNK